MGSLLNWRTKTDQLLRRLDATLAAEKTEAAELALAQQELEIGNKAQVVVQAVAAAVQQEAHAAIARLVSRCLTAIFDRPYEFKILFERSRGKTVARMVFARGDLELDPMTAAGGGVVDVAAFALRLACVCLSQPRVRGFLVLDEPFRFVSANYRPNLRQLLLQLSAELNLQFVIVTHIEELEIGKVIRL